MDQNSVAKHYEIDFDMIFRLNAAQNLVVKHYIIEFYMIFHFIMQLKTWLHSIMKEILT